MQTIELAANFQVREYLRPQIPDITLWEDRPDWSRFIELHDEFKAFSVSWFIRNGKDLTEYDGCSLGKACSFFLYYDLESWVRATVLFEAIAKEGTPCRFHIPGPDYMPPAMYDFLDSLENKYGPVIEVVSLDLKDHGVESSLSHVLHGTRALKPLKLHDAIALPPDELPETKHRCLALGFRNGREYIRQLAETPALHDDLHLVFDNNYSVTPWIAPPYTKPEIASFASFVQVDPVELEKFLPEAEAMATSLGEAMEEAVSQTGFLPPVARRFLPAIFREYVEKTMESQFMGYCYLREVVERYSITRTLNNLHDDSESYYCKHLMDKVGGKALFQPHGLIGKDKPTAAIRNDLAHTYFYYSEGEKRCWEAMSDGTPHDMRPVRHTQFTGFAPPPPTDARKARIMVLADNFHCRLISKINYYEGQKKLLDTLANLGFEDVTIRLHGVFFNSYGALSLEDSVADTYLHGWPIDSMYGEPFSKAVEKYDLVIGPMSTCIYETLGKGIPFLAYSPGFRPSLDIDEMIKSIWMDGLLPKPCTDAEQLENLLRVYLENSHKILNEHRRSIEKIGLSREDELTVWKTVAAG